MSLFSAADRRFAQAMAKLSYCNPFLPERIQLECEALGNAFDEGAVVWSRQRDWERERPNIMRLHQRVESLVSRLGRKLGSEAPGEAEARLYQDLVLYLLYNRYRIEFGELVERALSAAKQPWQVKFWPKFLEDYQRLLPETLRQSSPDAAAHLFACFFQLRRAFEHIFNHIVGGSLPAAQLRAAVWQSIFTHDMRRYRRLLFDRMGDFTTLVVGPSGTGKELVARAIGLARFIPFDPAERRFVEPATEAFHALNIAALSPTLIESELFGHRRGAFTGAVADRAGWLEICRPLGAVFLDEIGELEAAIQVKLLRVLQTRTFQRLGETEGRTFHGKLIAATNQDLPAKMRAGTFRQDFYFRLCSDVIRTPSLREQLTDAPDDLTNLVSFLVARILRADEHEAVDEISAEAVQWITQHLGPEYPWPGNIRELEQCVRNVIVRNRYVPAAGLDASRGGLEAQPYEELASKMLACGLTADQLLACYCTLVYAQCGSYERAANTLGLDRRTVKSRIDKGLLTRLVASTRPLDTLGPGDATQ